MSIRFRKRIRLIPGIWINFSKSGVSTTIGPRGLNFNVGKDGTYLNAGIPGSGFYMRQRLFGGDGKEKKLNSEISDDSIQNIIPTNGGEFATSPGLAVLKEHVENARKEWTEVSIELTKAQQEYSKQKKRLENRKYTTWGKLITSNAKIADLEKELEEYSEYLKDLESQYKESQAEINVGFDENHEDHFNRVVEAFRQMATAKKIWEIRNEQGIFGGKNAAQSSVNREEVRFSLKDLGFIKSKLPALNLENTCGDQIYILPAFMLIIDSEDNLSLLDYNELNFKFNIAAFIENKEDIPADTPIASYTWAKVNKDGSPDRRFAENYQIPVVHYGLLNFETNTGFNNKYHVSNLKFSKSFASEFLTYFSMVSNKPSNIGANLTTDIELISQPKFEKLRKFADKHLEFISDLEQDSNFTRLMLDYELSKKIPSVKEDKLLTLFLTIDLLNCFNFVSDLSDFKSKEVLALLYIMTKKGGLKIESEADFIKLYQNNRIQNYIEILESLKDFIGQKDGVKPLFHISKLLSRFDRELQQLYLSSLYRFASIIVKMDDTVTKDEEEALKLIIDLSDKPSIEDISYKKTAANERLSEGDFDKNIEESLNELNELIGLSSVKSQINTLVNFVKVQKTREEKGFKSSSLSYHVVFTGNPGTGKTTVARIVAQIFKALGVLQKGHLVETDRSGLVAEYLGQTAVKVNKIVDSALDGVLFIDEAYSIVANSQDSYGKEAVSTLIKRIEDDRERLIVILAGYTAEIQEFIETNPGFKSRFNRYIEFIDYSPEELLQIFEMLCAKLDYKITEEARNRLLKLFTNAFQNRDKTFGNGRFARNIFEKSMEQQANRIAGLPSITDELLITISEEDIPENQK